MAFESKAALIYSSRLPISKFVDRNKFGIYEKGHKFLVMDACSDFKIVNPINILFFRSCSLC